MSYKVDALVKRRTARNLSVLHGVIFGKIDSSLLLGQFSLRVPACETRGPEFLFAPPQQSRNRCLRSFLGCRVRLTFLYRVIYLSGAPPRSFDWGTDSVSSNPPTPKFCFLHGFRSLYFENIEQCKFFRKLLKNICKNREFWGGRPTQTIEPGDVSLPSPRCRRPCYLSTSFVIRSWLYSACTTLPLRF